jgi:hypothetical protein
MRRLEFIRERKRMQAALDLSSTQLADKDLQLADKDKLLAEQDKQVLALLTGPCLVNP